MKTPSAALIIIMLIAGCGTEPDASTSRAPSATGTVAASAAGSLPAEQALSFDDVERGGPLPAGTYVMPYASIGGAERFPTLSFQFTVPSGWQRVGVDGLLWNDNGPGILFAVADNVFADPCDPDTQAVTPAVGPTVDELTRALAAVPGVSTGEVEWDQFFGFMGNHITLTGDPEASCAEESRLLRAAGFPGYVPGPGEGERADMWILSVEGTRVVIVSPLDEDASDGAIAEVQDILASIVITP
jgi:hypothetical protein